MKKSILLLFAIVIGYPTLYAQDLSVPDSILKELQTVTLVDESEDTDSLLFRVVYPKSFNSSKSYPVFLALSGGNQSKKIVDYCYAAWFRSNYFDNYITILPISPKGKNLKNYSEEEIHKIEKLIKANFKVSKKHWIIAGTSNGGLATFNFVSASPKLYDAAIGIPGIIDEGVNVSKKWKHLEIVLAYGENDSEHWIESVPKSQKKAETHAKKVSTLMLKGQGHILPIGFDINQVYRLYFGAEK